MKMMPYKRNRFIKVDEVGLQWCDEAYQMTEECIFWRVLSTGAFVMAAWTRLIAHHSPSFGTVNLPSDRAQIRGQQQQPSQWGRPWKMLQSSHIQTAVWKPNSCFPHWKVESRAGLLFSFWHLLRKAAWNLTVCIWEQEAKFSSAWWAGGWE